MKKEKTSIDRGAGLDMIQADSSAECFSVVCLCGSIPAALFFASCSLWFPRVRPVDEAI